MLVLGLCLKSKMACPIPSQTVVDKPITNVLIWEQVKIEIGIWQPSNLSLWQLIKLIKLDDYA